MVAIVSSPAQGKLREVSRTDHEAVRLVRHVHKKLGTLTGLAVLVRHVMYMDVVIDILEVLDASLLDGDLPEGHAKGAYQVTGIGIGTIRRSEAGHGDADDLIPWDLQGIEGHDGDQ